MKTYVVGIDSEVHTNLEFLDGEASEEEQYGFRLQDGRILVPQVHWEVYDPAKNRQDMA